MALASRVLLTLYDTTGVLPDYQLRETHVGV